MRSADEIRRINESMTRANGDRQVAAMELQIEKRRLTQILHSTPSLKAIWCPAKNTLPVTALEVMKGLDMQPMTVESAEALEAANDKSFEALLEKSLDPAELATARSLSKMWGKHLGQCGELIGGTLVERALKLKAQIQKAQDEMNAGFEGESAGLQYQARSIFVIEAHKILLSVQDGITKTTMARAKLKEMSQQGNGGRPGGKPGFGPKVAINVNHLTMAK